MPASWVRPCSKPSPSLALMSASPQRAQAAADTAASLQAIHDVLTTMLANLPENSVAARTLGELATWTGRALKSLRPAPRGASGALKGRSRRALAAKGHDLPLDILVNQILAIPGPETIPPRTPYHLPPDRQALLSPTSDLLPQFIAGFYPARRASFTPRITTSA